LRSRSPARQKAPGTSVDTYQTDQSISRPILFNARLLLVLSTTTFPNVIAFVDFKYCAIDTTKKSEWSENKVGLLNMLSAKSDNACRLRRGLNFWGNGRCRRILARRGEFPVRGPARVWWIPATTPSAS
jgi:hypothetical protein